jgi:hypothetical protein
MDGFSSKEDAAMVILPPPAKGYLGIKPAVVIVEDPQIIDMVKAQREQERIKEVERELEREKTYGQHHH